MFIGQLNQTKNEEVQLSQVTPISTIKLIPKKADGARTKKEEKMNPRELFTITSFSNSVPKNLSTNWFQTSALPAGENWIKSLLYLLGK